MYLPVWGWYLALSLYGIGVVICLIYCFFDENVGDDGFGHISWFGALFLTALWPGVLVIGALILWVCVPIGDLLNHLSEKRKEWLKKRKIRRVQTEAARTAAKEAERMQEDVRRAEAEAERRKAEEEKRVADYRASNCSGCGRPLQKGGDA